MKLSQIQFPVYKLEKIKPNIQEGIVSYTKRNDQYIVDNTNIHGDTLAIRRLKMHMDGIKLHKLKYALFHPADLIKLGVPSQWFIDSSGKIFTYTKSKLVPLIFRQITNVIKGIAECMIEAQGINGRHKSLYPPREDQHYAGFLRVAPMTYILYGYFTEKHKDTVRKI